MEWRGAASSMSETTSFSKLSLAVLSGLREHPWFHFSTDGGGVRDPDRGESGF